MRSALRSLSIWAGVFAVAVFAAMLLPHPAHAAGVVSSVGHLAPLMFVGATSDVLGWLRGARAKPNALAEGSQAQARANRYAEAIVRATDRYQYADEGAYFTAQNPTVGTGVALNAQIQAFSATNGFIVLRNTASVGSGIRCYLDCLELIVTAATTAVASVDLLAVLDTIDRSPSTAANGTAATPVNVNSDDATGSALSVIGYNAGGAMTIPAASGSSRRASRLHAATGLHFAGDSIVFKFGCEPDGATQGLTAVRAVGAAKTIAAGAPVIIGPQQTCVLHRWSLTEAGAPSYEWELRWWERAA